MALQNTATSYGSVTRVFHWITALLIIVAMPLGLIANELPFSTDEELARKAVLFSIHKTIGVTAFLVALARILWALGQPKPAPVHPERRLESWAAETAHWLLYASMVIVPLSGWLHHAATTGFAPILWPFGQSLPFVPVSEPVAKFFAAWHFVFTKVLGLAVLLHIAGALKHALLERDGVLARMAFGSEAGQGGVHGNRVPFLTAVAITLLALVGGTVLGLPKAGTEARTLAEVETGWAVQEGTLAIRVEQLGGAVNGTFDEWTASITFDPDASGETKGSVEVTIAIASLQLGSVNEQAMGVDFFHVEAFPTATFIADLNPADQGYIADGVLTLKGSEVPVTLAFDLVIEGETATMSGSTRVDRRDFNIGESYTDEASVSFPVDITVTLSATRQ